MAEGVFYGVGVGPGDPELLTIKAIQVIRAADVIIAPKTEKKSDSTALGIAKPYIAAETRVLKLVFPMVYDGTALTDAWEQNKNAILELLQQGKKVVFLTLGDPMFYSTYIYVHRLLENSGYPIEIVPGITAFCAIGSRLGQSLAEGDEILSVIPATAQEEAIDQALATADKVVMMKVYRNFPRVLQQLEKHGLAEEAVMISNCGMKNEQIRRNLQADTLEKTSYFSTILARKKR